MPIPPELLSAVLASPADDWPRLVCAEWLDDHGETERAEFIRVQVAIARDYGVRLACENAQAVYTRIGDFTPRCRCRPCQLKRREYHCARRHLNADWLYEVWDVFGRREWVERMRQWSEGVQVSDHAPPRPLAPVPPPVPRVEYRRGFVAEAQMRVADVLDHGPALCRAVPLETIAVSGRSPYRATENGQPSYFWYRANRATCFDAASVVPADLWPVGQDYFAELPTPEAAHAWLSDVTLAWCRRAAAAPAEK